MGLATRAARQRHAWRWLALIVVAALTAVISPIAATADAAAQAEQPNFLFLFADDFAPDAIAALGDSQVITPNLDTLVGQGTSFTNAYNQGAWLDAVCRSSRDMLEHGYFLGNAETQTAARRAANQGATHLLAASGYETYFAGKLHMTGLVQNEEGVRSLGFANVGTVQRALLPHQFTGEDPYRNRPLEGEPDPWSPTDPAFGAFWNTTVVDGQPVVTHASEVLADEGVGFLQQAARSDAPPFYIQLSFNAPHDPRQAPQEFLDLYVLEDIEVPANFPASGIYEHAQGLGLNTNLRDEDLAPFPRTEFAIRTHLREYYAAVSHMDAQIGRVLDELDASGQRDNTYVFLAGDHGLAMGQHGLLGKQNMFEHSVGTPLVISGPDIAAGATNDARVYYQDVMPTMFELGGVTGVPSDWQFTSLLPLLRGETTEGYPAIYGGYMTSQRMIINDDHKLILYPTLEVSLLYDLRGDPLEMNDLIDEPGYDGRARALFAELLSLQIDVGDTLDLATAFPELAGPASETVIRIDAEDYDDAFDTDPENFGGTAFAPPADVFAHANGPDGQRPGHVIGRTRGGETLTYVDRRLSEGVWRIEASWASGFEPGPGAMSLSVDGRQVGSFDASDGHWWVFEESTFGEIALAQGDHTLVVEFIDPGQINFDYLLLTRVGDLPDITLGDVDCDGSATLLDVELLLGYQAGTVEGLDGCPLDNGQPEANLTIADLDGDGAVTTRDPLVLAQCVVRPVGVSLPDACTDVELAQ